MGAKVLSQEVYSEKIEPPIKQLLSELRAQLELRDKPHQPAVANNS